MTQLGLIPLLLASSWSAGAAGAPAGASSPGVFLQTDSAAPAPAVALSTLTVEIWPEYDDPRVLVIYSGTLEPGVKVPTDFSILVPAGAQIHMAGGVAPDGGHVHAEFTTSADKDGLTRVAYSLTVPNFYMEFYYDPLTGAEKRDFTYPVVLPYDVTALKVAVQEPRRAKDFTVTPYTPTVTQDDSGFLYYVIQRDTLSAGTTQPVAVTYTKTDDKPSVEPQQAGAGTGPGAPGRSDLGTILFYASMLLAAAGVVAFIVTSRTRSGGAGAMNEGDPGRRHGPFEGTPTPSEEETPRSPRFCTECGEALEPGDRFCPACGQPTRRPKTREDAPVMATARTT